MSKVINVKIGKYYYEKFSKQVRDKRDLVLIILDTIDALCAVQNKLDAEKGRIFVQVDKMSRIFYDLEDKMFSIVFPFSLAMQAKETYMIYDPTTDVEMDSKAVSFIRTIVNRMENFNGTFEQLIEQVYFEASTEDFEEKYIDNCCMITLRLFTIESGYIRYDYDAEHQNGIRHPLNHLDINYSTKCTYKLGLPHRIDMDEFSDMLNVETDCKFVN